MAFEIEVGKLKLLDGLEDFAEVVLVELDLEVVFVDDLGLVVFEGGGDLFDLGLEREGEGFFVAEGADQFFCLVEGDELAFVNDGGAVAELLGFFEVVGGEEDGGAGGVEFFHIGPEVVA